MRFNKLSGALAGLALSFSGSASAQGPVTPADIEAIAGNIGPVITELGAGLGSTVEALQGPDPAATVVELNLGGGFGGGNVSHLLDAVVNGTQYAGIGLGMNTFVFSHIRSLTGPYTAVLDDPSIENFEAALAPEDLNTIAANLQTVPENTWHGSGGVSFFSPYGNGLQAALIDVLTVGAHTHDTHLCFGSCGNKEDYEHLIEHALHTPQGALTLFNDTNLRNLQTGSGGVAVIARQVIYPAAEENDLYNQLDQVLIPLYEQGAPLLVPAAESVKAAEVPEIPEF